MASDITQKYSHFPSFALRHAVRLAVMAMTPRNISNMAEQVRHSGPTSIGNMRSIKIAAFLTNTPFKGVAAGASYFIIYYLDWSTRSDRRR